MGYIGLKSVSHAQLAANIVIFTLKIICQLRIRLIIQWQILAQVMDYVPIP